MNKKGFTLVELLAVLIIIGILLTMVILSVSNYIGRGKREYYHAIEDTLKVAGRDYVIDYKSLLPREIGNSTVISVEELVLNNYIDELIDEDKNPCTGNLMIVKKDKNEYDYHVCLQCNDKYTSDEEYCEEVESSGNNTAAQYTITLNGNVTEVVDQCQSLSLPTASVYQTINGKNTLINGNLKSVPTNVDTTILGETTVKWSYRYKSISKTVRVDDNVAPITPTVKITYLNGSEYVGRRADGSPNITNKDLIMTVSSHDYACQSIYPNLDGSGISHISYKANNEDAWTNISTRKDTTRTTLSKTIMGSVELKVVDNYDNSSNNAASFELYMDKVKPSKTVVTYLGGSNSHSWKNNYNLELSSTDNLTVAYYEVDWNNDGIVDETTDNTYVPTNGFNYCNVRFRAVDIAGNRGAWSDKQHIHMDTQAPSKTTVSLGGYTSGVWTNSNIVQTYNSSDNIGIAFYEYSSDKTTISGTTVKNWTLDNDGEYSYYARAVDNAGNRGAWSEIYHMKRDTVKPSCTVVVTNQPTVFNGYYISPINFGFGEANDDRSQIKSAILNRNTISTSADGNTVIGTVTDNANNVKTCSIKVNVDLVTPTMSSKNSTLTLGNEEYDFTQNVNLSYGTLGGSVQCNPPTSKKTGNYNVTCTSTGNNGKTSSITFQVNHSYPATYVTNKYSVTCNNPVNCYSCGDNGYNCCWYSCSDGISREGVKSYMASDGSWQGWGESHTFTETSSYYSCPNGGTAIGNTCYY